MRPGQTPRELRTQVRWTDPGDLLDRRAELDAVSRLLDDVAEGTGGLVLVEGDAGIGKTGILRAAGGLAAARGMRVVSARGGELEADLAFGIARELLAAELHAGGPRLPDDAAALAGPVLSAAPRPEDTTTDAFGALHGLYWLVAALGADRPTLVVVDDAHWADLPSLRFLSYLARRIEGLAVGLLVANRPADGDRRDLLRILADDPCARVLRPRPLGDAAVHALVSGSFDTVVEPAFSAACRAATGGVPFLLRELLSEAAEVGIDPRTTSVDELAAVVPPTVTHSVAARLSRLPAGASDLARAVAVLGDGGDPRRAGRLASLDPTQVGPLVDELVEARIFGPSASPEFRHPLVRAAVESGIGPAVLADMHGRAAALLRAEGADLGALVSHLLVSAPRGEPGTVDDLMAAAREADGRGAPDTAVTYLRRALAEPPEPGRRSSVLMQLGLAELRAGFPTAGAHLAAAAAAAVEPVARCRVNLRLARALTFSGRIPDAIALAEQTLGDLGARDVDLGMQVEAELLIAATQDLATRPVAERRHAGRTEDPEPTGRGACMLLSVMALEQVVRSGSRDRAADLARKSLTGGWLFDQEATVALPSALTSLALSGHARRAVTVWNEVVEGRRSRADIRGFAHASAFRGHASHLTGDLETAIADARAVLELAAESPLLAVASGYAATWLTFASIDTGDLDTAERELALVPPALSAGAPAVGQHLLCARGRLRLAQGRYADAVADLIECGHRLARWGSHGTAACPWRAPLVLALHGLGEDTTHAARDAVRTARQWGVPAMVAEALRAAGTARGRADGLAMLRSAVEAAAEGESPQERSRCLTALGGALRRSGARVGAREPLTSALDIAASCGAHALVAEARAELVATGARPRRIRTSGWDALTATERRVARTVMDGATNRAAAQALFVSEKTIESHLANIFRKLGVASRSQLRSQMTDAG
jgi:DNA-binding CsgD family transcriptional regulator